MMKKSFHLHTDDEHLIKFLQSQKNISAYLAEIINKYRSGELVDRLDAESTKELNATLKQKQIEYNILRNENYTYKNRIDAVRAVAAETFNGKISPEADKAIKQRFESAKPQTAKQISINGVLRFMESCRQNDVKQWVVICEKCRSDFIDTDRETALTEFRDHMVKNHTEELLT